MFGMFGPKPKFKLKEKMEVELEFESPDGYRSHFSSVLGESRKKGKFGTPKVGKKYLPISKDDIVRMICLIEDTLFEVNLKVTQAMESEFEALVSKNITRLGTVLKKSSKKQPVELEIEVPLDFRAITTSHMQRAQTGKITREYVEMITNLPVPEGTDLRIIFKVPESPAVETEGVSAKSERVEEDSRKSKTRINFPEKVVESEVFDDVTRYVVHYQRRVERRKELEEAKEEAQKPDDKKKKKK